MFLMRKFLIKLVKHSTKHNTNRNPLHHIHIMTEQENTQDYSQNLSCCCYQRKYMLLEISNNVVDTDLTYHLQETYSYQMP